MRLELSLLLSLFLGCATGPPPLRLALPASDPAKVSQERVLHYDEAMKQYREKVARLVRVAAPILLESAELCGDRVVPYLGAVFLAPKDLDNWTYRIETRSELEDAARRVLSLRSGLTVIVTIPGSPGEAAGIEPGDLLTAVNSTAADSSEELISALRRARYQRPDLAFDRGNQLFEPEIEYRASCDISLVLSLTPNFVVFAREGEVSVSSGTMDFATRDDELAFVLAHEFAHVLLGHRFGSDKPSERAADYLGCYLAARAGYDISVGPSLWRRWARLAPMIISNYQYSHEGSPERAILVEKTIEEIERKRQIGLPLLPNMRP